MSFEDMGKEGNISLCVFIVRGDGWDSDPGI